MDALLAFATGVKLAHPELEVFVVMGDGDATAIGGNHLIHAARRNIGLNAIVINNNIYGMTGGQYSPPTPTGMKATTAPYGMVERNFDLCELASSRRHLCGTGNRVPCKATDGFDFGIHGKQKGSPWWKLFPPVL